MPEMLRSLGNTMVCQWRDKIVLIVYRTGIDPGKYWVKWREVMPDGSLGEKEWSGAESALIRKGHFRAYDGEYEIRVHLKPKSAA